MTESLAWKPANLHVSHSWGGGLGRWIRNFCGADPYSNSLVLQSHGSHDAYGVEHRLEHAGTGAVLERWGLSTPVTEIGIDNPRYAEKLQQLIGRYGIEHLYISSFIGHSLDLLDLDVAMTIVYHDYFPFCPALNLTFVDVCKSCMPHKLRLCLDKNPLATGFRQNRPEYWQRLRESYFARLRRPRLNHVSPSLSVQRNLGSVDERFNELEFRNIEHGIDYRKSDCFGGAEHGRQLRFLVLGILSPFKGQARLRRLLPQLRLLGDIYLVGSGSSGREFAGRAGVTLIEEYTRDELPSILADLRPDLALFLGDVPETFSFTLSEAWAHGIPVCAPRLGSFEDRIEDGRTGFLVDLDEDSLISTLVDVEAERGRLLDVASEIARRPVRSLEEMVDDYYELRDDYLVWCEQRLGHGA